MEQHEIVSRLIVLRNEINERTIQGQDASRHQRIYKAVGECVVKGDLPTATWILATGRVAKGQVFPSRDVIPIKLVRDTYGKRVGGG